MRNYIDIVENKLALQNPNFKKWFEGSKVVDKQGNPLVCYHGTFEDFANFSYASENRVSRDFNRLGFWFDVDPETPNYFAGYYENREATGGGNVKPCFLSIKRPLGMDSEAFWNDDREKLSAIKAELDPLQKLYRKVKSDGIRLRDEFGNIFDEQKYYKLRKEFDKLYHSLNTRSTRDDGWNRLMDMLPNGVKTRTADVIAFQQECIAEGYDGIWIGETTADFESRNFRATDWWIAFHPHQIKSIFATNFNDSDDIGD